MKYTKGERENAGDGVIIATDGKQITSVFPITRESNSNLITAAPAMYEYLKELADAIDKGEERLGAGRGMRLSNILAKAEGKTNDI